jgi:hypothetical protein
LTSPQQFWVFLLAEVCFRNRNTCNKTAKIAKFNRYLLGMDIWNRTQRENGDEKLSTGLSDTQMSMHTRGDPGMKEANENLGRYLHLPKVTGIFSS